MLLETYSQTIQFPSELHSINLVDQFIDDLFLKYNICVEQHEANIKTSITEVVTNAIIHGNKNDCTKSVNLTYRIDDLKLSFIIEDQGCGFDPNSIPDPTLPENLEKLSGRGLFIIKHLCTDVVFYNNGSKIECIFHF